MLVASPLKPEIKPAASGKKGKAGKAVCCQLGHQVIDIQALTKILVIVFVFNVKAQQFLLPELRADSGSTIAITLFVS